MVRLIECERKDGMINIEPPDNATQNYIYQRERGEDHAWHRDCYYLDREEGINRWQLQSR